jgi:hypothetical protein
LLLLLLLLLIVGDVAVDADVDGDADEMVDVEVDEKAGVYDGQGNRLAVRHVINTHSPSLEAQLRGMKGMTK